MQKKISLILAFLMVLSVFVAVSVTATAATSSTGDLIAKGDTWYCHSGDYVGSCEAGAPSETWTTDDTYLTWEQMQAPFGDGTYNPCAGTKTSLGSVFSAYLVKVFDLANVDSIDTLTMRICYDQDPLVFVNGNLVWSATGWTSGGAYATVDLDPSILKSGKNVVAVYFCNPAGGGGAAMDLSLTAARSFDLIAKNSTWNYVTYETSAEIAKLTQSVPLPAGWTDDLSLINDEWFADKTVTDAEGTEYALNTLKNRVSGTGQASIGCNSPYGGNNKVDIGYYFFLGYMNTTFTLTDSEVVGRLFMDIFYDEDPIVYINGTRVWSATSYKTDYTTVDLSNYRYLLRDGENTVAVSWENNFGGNFLDLSLYYEESTTNAIACKPSCTGFMNFGGLNAPENMIDGSDSSCCGSGFDGNGNQTWSFTFANEKYVKEVYIQSKNENTTTDPAGRYGLFNVYVLQYGNWRLCATEVPAMVGDGNGMTVPVGATTTEVKVVPTVWWGDNWANISEFKAYKGTAPENTLNFDGDENDSINIGDVSMLLNYLADGNTILAPGSDPDTTGDNACNIADVTTLLNYLATSTGNQ